MGEVHLSKLLRIAVAGAFAFPLATQAAAPAKTAAPKTAAPAKAAPAPARTGPTLADVFANSGISLSGYVDAGYNWNSEGFAATPFTYNGTTANTFILNQVGLSLSSTPSEGFGAVVDILGGNDATALPQDGTGGNEIMFKQAYVQYATGALQVIGGRFVTLAGSEVLASTGNSNASRSLLFAYQPTTLTGARASFKAAEGLTLHGGLSNDATGSTEDPEQRKAIELGAAFAPASNVSLAATGYKGGGTAGSSPMLIDLVGSMGLSSTVSVGANVDYLNLDNGTNTKVTGAALYGNLQATDVLRFGARVEYVKTKDNAAPKKQKEVTLTAGYAAAKNFDVLADLRYDKDDSAPFNGEDSMTSLVAKGIYKF